MRLVCATAAEMPARSRNRAGVRLSVGEEVDRLGVETERHFQGVVGGRPPAGAEAIDKLPRLQLGGGGRRHQLRLPRDAWLLKMTMLKEASPGKPSMAAVNSRAAAASRDPAMLPEMSTTNTTRRA